MAGKMRGKVILVTGASRGLGLADVVEFVKEDAETIIMLSKSKDQLIESAIEARKHGNTIILTYVLDISKEEEWISFMKDIREYVNRIDVLVNNAGINKRDTYEECTLKDWEEIVSVNQTGIFLGTKYCLPLLKKSGNASVINMSSIIGLTGYYAIAYTATKWAVRGMTKSAAMEFGKWGIRVNSVLPGFIDTPLNESIQDVIAASNEMNALGRAGESEEVAKAVLFLASDDSSYITGSEIVIDGGLTSGGQFKAIADKLNLY
jgi:3alpha(or 20beta)-hydroxysteroid dehydrogenase